ncbi:MAG: hypothetical protein JW834_02105 [Candidatus Diapherotrites archaeon]|nr:hypothetical protein [Candidatus Diapherotrites archaeon]
MKGITPIVTVVLLIAISIIATVTVYFWVSGEPKRPLDAEEPVEINAVIVNDSYVRITNTDTQDLAGAQVFFVAENASANCSTPALAAGEGAVCELYDFSGQLTVFNENTTYVTLVAL